MIFTIISHNSDKITWGSVCCSASCWNEIDKVNLPKMLASLNVILSFYILPLLRSAQGNGFLWNLLRSWPRWPSGSCGNAATQYIRKDCACERFFSFLLECILVSLHILFILLSFHVLAPLWITMRDWRNVAMVMDWPIVICVVQNSTNSDLTLRYVMTAFM